MTIYTTLKKEHDEILNYLNRIDECGTEETEKRNILFNKLKETLLTHSRAEKESFHKPLKKYEITHDKVAFYEEEQEAIEDLLSLLTDPDLSGALWLRKFQQLKEELEFHIHDDEHELFPKAKSVIDNKQAKEMDQSLKAMQQTEKEHSDIKKRPLRKSNE